MSQNGIEQCKKKYSLSNLSLEEFKKFYSINKRNKLLLYDFITDISICPINLIEDILYYLLDDSNYLVRVNACDSLSESNNISYLNKLYELASKDKYYLVRGYAVMAYGDISAKNKIICNIEKINKLLFDEKSKWVKLNCYYALYIMGKTNYISNIIMCLKSKNYKLRSATVHILNNIIDEKNKIYVLNVLKEHLKIESTIAVTSLINDILMEYNV